MHESACKGGKGEQEETVSSDTFISKSQCAQEPLSCTGGKKPQDRGEGEKGGIRKNKERRGTRNKEAMQTATLKTVDSLESPAATTRNLSKQGVGGHRTKNKTTFAGQQGKRGLRMGLFLPFKCRQYTQGHKKSGTDGRTKAERRSSAQPAGVLTVCLVQDYWRGTTGGSATTDSTGPPCEARVKEKENRGKMAHNCHWKRDTTLKKKSVRASAERRTRTGRKGGGKMRVAALRRRKKQEVRRPRGDLHRGSPLHLHLPIHIFKTLGGGEEKSRGGDPEEAKGDLDAGGRFKPSLGRNRVSWVKGAVALSSSLDHTEKAKTGEEVPSERRRARSSDTGSYSYTKTVLTRLSRDLRG